MKTIVDLENDLVKPYIDKEITTRATLGAHNLFDIEAWLKSIGTNFTKNGNVYTLSAGGYIYSMPYVFSDEDIDVTLTGVISSLTSNNVRFELLNSNDQQVVSLSESVAEATGRGCKIRVNWSSGGNFTISEPMIRLVTDADNTYRSYVPANKDLLSYADNGILGAKNFWKNGNQSFTSVVYNLDVSNIPNGTYIFSADVTSTDTDATTCAVYDVTNAKSYQIGRGNNVSVEITLNNTQKLSLYASSYSEISIGDTASFTNVMIRRVNDTDAIYQPYAMTNQELTDQIPWKLVANTTPFTNDLTKYNELMFCGMRGTAVAQTIIIPKDFITSNRQFRCDYGASDNVTLTLNSPPSSGGRVNYTGTFFEDFSLFGR